MDTRGRPSSGYQGESIDYSLMDPPEGRTVRVAGNPHTCFARVIEIASRIIFGQPARKSMSVSTKWNSEKRISGAQDEGMGPSENGLMDTRERPSSILSIELKFQTSSEQTGAREIHILASVQVLQLQQNIIPNFKNGKAQVNEVDRALHLMIGNLHNGPLPIQRYLCKLINIQVI